MTKLCLDTQVLIWGVKNESADGQEDRIPASREFIEEAEAKDYVLVVPAVAVHEMLIKAPVERRPGLLAELRGNMEIEPFDERAAVEAANIESAWISQGNKRRERLRFDIQIVATAMACGADVLLSEDPDVSRLAEGNIRCRGLHGIAEATVGSAPSRNKRRRPAPPPGQMSFEGDEPPEHL